MLAKYKYHFWLHFIVLLFALTGPLGNSIETSYDILVFYRMLIAVVGIAGYFLISGHKINMTPKNIRNALLTGIVIAFHWLTFFEAINQSNVSVALVCFSSSTLFTALIEPFYFKRKIRPYEIILGLLIVFGLYLIINVELKYVWGMILSFISAFLASWFTVLNGRFIKESDAKSISFFEMIGGAVICGLFVLILEHDQLEVLNISVSDWWRILVLGLVCTSFAFIVSVEVMKKISPFTVTISVNLEPVYSVIIALILWPEEEKMSPMFYVGTGIIMTSIFLNAVFKKN